MEGNANAEQPSKQQISIRRPGHYAFPFPSVEFPQMVKRWNSCKMEIKSEQVFGDLGYIARKEEEMSFFPNHDSEVIVLVRPLPWLYTEP